jgi:flavin reductase (DIM6/NTAB) family NADH-FMN oxidoreductase RutF
MSQFATGVAVVATLAADGRPMGITVNSLTSVSLTPPLVLVAIDRRRAIWPVLKAASGYAVSILSEEQGPLADCFAGLTSSPSRDSFCDAPWRPGPRGLPILEGALAALEARLEQVVPAGDHDLFLARVETLDLFREDGWPLLFFRRRYLRIERATPLGPPREVFPRRGDPDSQDS